ncbi:Putative vacuolar membrane transporter for cationic amino acids [Purpureocillium takamizusanense]|uniref:Vacuolar membrane transporter for cationic amino acids n=1 Tax=Purpureocillium takamizusanense TaxID=2060973 RepID=A0A9Q8QLD8_9HYPO|nr:Putative vacuolar membrane transporter for cationic amino acids [Purpureocillium takamizusanense]UNI21357.1 Putative vacuolar membrane transporter for cationic amino acids [Purpureocillium takamizusanense]
MSATVAPPTGTFHLDVEAISGICGSVSIACWVVVFSPQIIQQFQQGNADGLSIQFIIIWLLGDVFNILGAVLQGVLPTMIILAVYYTIADIVLLCQCFYYRGFTWRDEPTPPPPPKTTANNVGEPSERTSLLPHRHEQQHHEQHRNPYHPEYHPERRGSDWTGLSPAVPHVSESAVPPPPPTALQTIVWNATIVVMVCAAGVLGWYLGEKATSGKEKPHHDAGDSLHFNVLGQFFGYLCAVAYIASRMPQLILNWRRKTTDGLSMLFFLFACLGNITYVLSIFAYDPKCPGDACEPGEASRIYGRYILVNLSWLAGSLVTLLMDIGVFVQYFIYKTDEEAPRDVFEDTPWPTSRRDSEEQQEQWDNRPLLQRGDSGM